MANISRIKYVNIKHVWSKEDRDLTPWLHSNIDVISEAINCPIVNPEIEQFTGDTSGFKVDIIAELETGGKVVIENQFGVSDHDHLGKLLTYRTAFDAKVAIWLVERARQEHIDVINWLNENDNGCSFFLLKLSAIQVDESAPAPLITLISGPIEDLQALGKIKKEEEHRHIERRKFWTQLLQTAKDSKISLLYRLSPSKDTWIAAGAGKSGINYHLWLNKDSMRIELRIDTQDQAENLSIFNKLKHHQKEIDSVIPNGWNWIGEEDAARRCSIQTTVTGGWKMDSSTWQITINEALDILQKLEKVTKHLIKTL